MARGGGLPTLSADPHAPAGEGASRNAGRSGELVVGEALGLLASELGFDLGAAAARADGVACHGHDRRDRPLGIQVGLEGRLPPDENDPTTEPRSGIRYH